MYVKPTQRLILLFFVSIISMFTFAQQRSITGTVTDVNGEAMIGVTVKEKGSSNGTITDFDGKYKLSVGNNSVLVVSYIGFTQQEITVGNQNVVNITLKEDLRSLDEVVVIGYGSVKKKDLTGSISSLKSDALAQVPVANVVEAMSGRMAGVRVTTTDGSPDADIMIRVRGGGSITQDNSPLYIVDGFPVNSFSDVPAGDIDDITVLKDASSTAIYGAQGANGVVLITTKSAQKGKTQVSYNGFLQSKRLANRLKVMNPYEYVKWNYENAAMNSEDAVKSFEKTFGYYDDIDLYQYQQPTDWQEDMFGSGQLSQQHNISITGGNDKTKYLISGTYNFDGGLMPNTDYSRYNLNFKLDQEIAKRLNFQFNARTTDTSTDGDGSSGGTNKIRTFQAITRGPVQGISGLVEKDPTMMSEEDYEQWVRDNMSLADQAAQYWRHRNQRSFTYNAALNWEIIKGLAYRVEGSYGYGFNENQRYWGETTVDASNNGGLPLVEQQKSNSSSYRLSNTLTYKFAIGKQHQFNVMAGQELNSSSSQSLTTRVFHFSKDLTPEKIFANLGLGESPTISSSYGEPTRLLSYFGRFGYNFGERYLATITLRADGSSKFAPGRQWGYFPSAAVAWRIVEEPFMLNTKDWLSDLKLRASYGEAGNNRISSGLYKSRYTISSSKTYALGDKQNNYYQSGSRLPNPLIKWESLVTKNVGLDFGIFNQRLFGTVEYYWNTSSDLLLDTKITAPGYTSMMLNIGQTTNRGLEITLNAAIIQKKNFSLVADFNIGFNKSNVDALDNDANFLTYATGWASTDLKGYDEYEVHVGQPVGIMYGWITDGYYTTSDFASYDSGTKKYIIAKDANGNPVAPETNSTLGGRIGIRPGTIKFKDISGKNGVPDGIIDDYDRTIIGNANPDFTGGFGISGTVKNFDFALNFNFVYGNDIYNASKLASVQQYRTTNPNLLDIMNSSQRYTYINEATGDVVTDLATLAAMNEGANAKKYWSPLSFGNSNAVIHSWAIEDGSFLRLQNITVGYTLPKKISSMFYCSRLRAYCTLNNVWLWTNYSGYDPEVSSQGRGSTSPQMIPGLDYSSYPKSFSMTFGLNVQF
ncbi:MAG: TonB-dependent receptor [Paludibacter sp.]|jgi:TonB-linked SusC/RagA family outer membrane protein|nr:TonB-dependent receptor [Paludibacter sp.]